MEKRKLGNTGLQIAPLVFGGNVFGWTIDEKSSFTVLDAFIDHGFNAIDTADVYSSWAPGNKGGESETIIGRWLKARPGIREKVVIFTKVGSDLGSPDRKGLSERWITQAVEGSLKRLGIEAIDLYFSHWPDPDVSYEETLGAYEKLLKAGKIKAIGASNLNAGQLEAALSTAKEKGLPGYQVLQPEYNLYDRDAYDGALRDLCIKEGLGVVTYYSLASGFLSGKYRSKADLSQSQRGEGIAKYLTERGTKIISALEAVSARHSAKPAEVALAWLIQQAGVTAPIASATSVAQVASFANAVGLTLSPEDVKALDTASAY
ncbi:aldo/keto reductase [Brenneria izadpanahii]|uniref:Aldo/keto reductase n=1 Tax=Brenneria izadpanahii TaxID=2722756 RepID=A0ABX7UUN5_9GAMM|nr:aldo/keto reductase [Brenneria izadpanahii]QTF09010.1 aldo/keto reductase [Brenneria izadpanahii]